MARMRRGFGKVRRLPSGNYQASYVGPGGARVVAPGTYLAAVDAEGWLADERRYLERVGPEGWESPADRAAAAARAVSEAEDLRTVREFSEDWLRRRLKETTCEKYRQALKMRVWPGLGDVPLRKVTRARVRRWWDALDHEEHPRACDLAYQALRGLMNHAVELEVLSDNPCQVRGAGGASVHRSITPLTPAQVTACAEEMPEAWQIGVLLAAWCSIRSGEIRELRRSDIEIDKDGQKAVIRVQRAVVRSGGTLQTSSPKSTAGIRTVPVPTPLISLLRAHLKDHAQIGAQGLLVYSPVTGERVHDASWRRAWVRSAKAAGVVDFHFHDLRHTGLTYAAVAGATIKELQRLAGHTTPAMVMRYQEVAASHMDEVVDRLGDIISRHGVRGRARSTARAHQGHAPQSPGPVTDEDLPPGDGGHWSCDAAPSTHAGAQAPGNLNSCPMVVMILYGTRSAPAPSRSRGRSLSRQTETAPDSTEEPGAVGVGVGGRAVVTGVVMQT